MSVIGKQPFVNKILNSLSNTELDTLRGLLDNLGNPTFVSLTRRPFIGDGNKGVSYVTFELDDIAQTIASGILCYKDATHCGLFEFVNGFGLMKAYDINPTTKTFIVVYQNLSVDEFRRVLDEKREHGGDEWVDKMKPHLDYSAEVIGTSPEKVEVGTNLEVDGKIYVNESNDFMNSYGDNLTLVPHPENADLGKVMTVGTMGPTWLTPTKELPGYSESSFINSILKVSYNDTAYVLQWADFKSFLNISSSTSGKFLTNNGSYISWAAGGVKLYRHNINFVTSFSPMTQITCNLFSTTSTQINSVALFETLYSSNKIIGCTVYNSNDSLYCNALMNYNSTTKKLSFIHYSSTSTSASSIEVETVNDISSVAVIADTVFEL